MDGTDDLDQRGAELLAELAHDPGGDPARQFDALYYELVWRYLRANHATLGSRVARYMGADGVATPSVLDEEVAEVAHEATVIALRRVREHAGRFDAARGTATGWVIGAAEFAWIEVAKTIVAARRSDDLVFVPVEDLHEWADPNPSTEEHVIRHLQDAEAFADAADHLTEDEWTALRLVITGGYSYAEVAAMIFGDETKTRQVDGLLQRGKNKLAAAWSGRRASPNHAAAANLADRTADKEESDG
ncbi:MAG TPA: hypothetical protein VHX66_04700 [Solirubrobacteraceae bacterium]|jgi:DNA-directed RNA polymerase specialized sigma24 family protein|nr:hypothetical protein [Solirubrobacteraceae bacterium]